MERLEQWNKTAPYPQLISAVFVVNYDEQGHPRLSRLNAKVIKGSGVGLSLVKQIVEAHDGRVSVKSTPGRGSVFTLHLPIAAQAGELKDEVREDKKS